MLNLFISCKPRDNCSPQNSLYKVRGGYRQKAVIYQIKQVQVESVYSPPFSQHFTFVIIYDDDLLVTVANQCFAYFKYQDSDMQIRPFPSSLVPLFQTARANRDPQRKLGLVKHFSIALWAQNLTLFTGRSLVVTDILNAFQNVSSPE